METPKVMSSARGTAPWHLPTLLCILLCTQLLTNYQAGIIVPAGELNK